MPNLGLWGLPPSHFPARVQFCTICNGSRKLPNPELCSDCQPWDNVTHLTECKCERAKHPRLNLCIFSRPFGIGTTWGEDSLGGLEALRYRSLEVFESRPHCIVCGEIVAILQTFSRQTDNAQGLQFAAWQPCIFDADSTSKEPPLEERSRPGEHSTELCLLPGAIQVVNEENGAVSHAPVVLKLVLKYRETTHGLHSVRTWTPQPLSLENLARWLENCRHHHGEQCNTLITRIDTAPSGFRLVDTSTNSIVECTERVEYAALSYCWPRTSERYLQLLLHNVDQLSRPNGLDLGRLAPTIADAIQLCKNLDMRYLWVDQLCIIQDDPTSKFTQILAMDRIYNMADFTIVALSSTPGLPGVSTRPRDTSFDTVYGPWDGVLGYPPYPNWAVARSRWDTRGWTFQECKLSRRLVFVDDRHAYFSCFRGSFWEHHPRALKNEPGQPYITVEKGLHVEGSFGSYAELVAAYSKRQLSFRSDTLHAFAGVGTILAFKLETSLLYGLPERYLFRSLLWHPDLDSQGMPIEGSLPGIPSWSWAAWDGAVDYGPKRRSPFNIDEYGILGFGPLSAPHTGNLVTFFYSDHSRIVRRVDESLRWFDDVKDVKLREWQRRWSDRSNMPVLGACQNMLLAEPWQRCVHNPLEALLHADITPEAHSRAAATPGCLAFTTTCAVLTLRPAAPSLKPTSPVLYYDMYTTATDSSPAKFVGQTMIMGRGWAPRTLDLHQSYTVVVLGAGERNRAALNSYSFRKNPKGGYLETFCLYVMITEQRDGVLYRMAIGGVDLEVWTSINPTWQSVVVA